MESFLTSLASSVLPHCAYAYETGLLLRMLHFNSLPAEMPLRIFSLVAPSIPPLPPLLHPQDAYFGYPSCDPRYDALRSMALVCRSWRHAAQKLLWREVGITSKDQLDLFLDNPRVLDHEIQGSQDQDSLRYRESLRAFYAAAFDLFVGRRVGHTHVLWN